VHAIGPAIYPKHSAARAQDAALDAVTRTRADVRAVAAEVERIEAMTPARG
jgi:hypothetical protein